MPYLVPDLCEDKSSSMRECTLTRGAHTDMTVLDTIHLTPKVMQPFLGGCIDEMRKSYSGTTVSLPFLLL